MTKATSGWRLRDYFDLTIIAATHGLSDGFSSLLVPVLALIVSELNLTTLQAGLILSIRGFGTLLFLYPVSVLADSTGRRKEILIVGLSLSAVAYLSMGAAMTLQSMAVLAFLAGAGNATFHPCGTALTSERFASRKAVAISLLGLGGNVGTSLMPLVQSAVVAVANWRAAVAACTLPAAVLLPLTVIRFSDTATKRDIEQDSPTRGLRMLSEAVLKNRGVLLLALVYALTGMGSKGMIGFLPLLASQRHSMDTARIGVAVSAHFTLGILSKPLMGLLYNRWGARLALSVPLLLTGALTLAMGLTPWASTIIPLAALSGMVGFVSPVILTATADLCDERALASSVGFIYTCYALGSVSPLVGGWLAEQSGMSASFIFFAVAVFLGAGVAAILPKVPSQKLARERQVLS